MSVELTLTDLDPADQRNLMTFRLDQQTYALPIEPIMQIIEMVTITPIPQVSNKVEGVINVRGAPVPVVNLRRHLSLPEAALQLHTPIVLAQVGELMVGLIVDEVLDVRSLPGGQITRPADILPEGLGKTPILQGMAHTPHGMVLLLDLDHLFLPHQALALAHAIETQPQPTPKRRKKSPRTTLRQAQDPEVSKEAHLDEPDREVGT
jgi:purine-binding chemotaxis protein CheW